MSGGVSPSLAKPGTMPPDLKSGPARISKTPFGKCESARGVEEVDLYTLTNANGLRMKVITYGAIITALEVPDRNGKLGDIVLGFDDLASYVRANPYFGATVGRVGNRIRNARFELEAKVHELAANNSPHHLHGGQRGWDKVVWDAQPIESSEGSALKLTYVSPDGEEGYPATVRATVIYTLTNKNELRVVMDATTDGTTIVNMVHHTYWNLGGVDGLDAVDADTGGPTREPEVVTIVDHELALHAAAYTPGDPMVPTGETKSVAGTAFDFMTGKPIGRDLKAAGGDPVGFDHNFVVDGDPAQMRPVARLKDPTTGRVLTLEADQPGVQFYSGNFLDGTAIGKGGRRYAQYSGLCLETQKFPNAVNVPAWKSQVLLKPGQTYKHTMIHRFTAE